MSNGKDFYRVVTYNIKSTQLDDIKLLPGDEHILLPVSNSSLMSPLSPIDLLFVRSPNFKTPSEFDKTRTFLRKTKYK